MEQIRLTNGDICLVDDCNKYLSNYNWYFHKGYAYGRVNGKNVLMHRLIMNAPEDVLIDHINGNRLDNRLCNLRYANAQQNNFNRRAITNKLNTKFKGVFWIKEKQLYRAEIKMFSKSIRIGYFKNDEIAAHAYNVYASRLFGKYAKLNDVPIYDNWIYEKVFLTKTTFYRGVTEQRDGKFQARITINKKRVSIGYFNTAIDAAIAYNQFAIKHLGDKALLNKITDIMEEN